MSPRKHKAKSLEKGNLSTAPINLASIAEAIVVAEHQSISRAARALDVTSSTLSRRISSLEDTLGVSLFERHRNGVFLTAVGRSFFDRLRPSFKEIEEAVKFAALGGRGAEGVVRIGLAVPVSTFLEKLIAAFREECDGVLLAWHEGSRRSNLTKIVDRSLDVGIFCRFEHSFDFESELLWSSVVYIAMPDAHDLALGAEIDWAYLRDETFLFGWNEDAAELREIVLRHFCEFTKPPRIENYAVNQRSVLQFVAMGLGVTLISEPGELMQQHGVTFRPLADKKTALTFSAVWLAENDNPALRRFLSLARKMAKKG